MTYVFRLLLAAGAPVFAASAQTVVFDFGDKPFTFDLPAWRKGMPEWPSHNFTVPDGVCDWSGYDRLVLGFYNREGTDPLCCYVASSEGRVQDGMKTAEFYPEPGVYHHWTIPLRKWPETMDARRVGRIHVFFSRPHGVKADFHRAVLLKPGEDPPEVGPRFDGSMDLPRQRKRRREVLADFIRKCREAGQAGTPCFLGQASSMEKVRPRAPERSPEPATNLVVRLARNEYESMQLLVLPKGDMKNVRVAVSDLRHVDGRHSLKASNVCVSVTGYVKTERRPPYCVARNRPCETNDFGYIRERVDAEIGWWPDPLLGWLDKIDIAAHDLQSFWIRVHAPCSAEKGEYRGIVTVSTEGKDVAQLQLRVYVYGFRLPDRPLLKTAITFGPWPFSEGRLTQPEKDRRARLLGDRESPVNKWRLCRGEWIDFLSSYYIPFDNIYRTGSPDWDVLKRQKEKGRLGGFQLGFWAPPSDLKDETKAKWKADTLDRMKKTWREAVSAGLDGYAYIYGCDELPSDRFACASWAVDELKREFPGVPMLTTAYDSNYGVGSPLSRINGFVPLSSKFDVEKARLARQDGHEVWWYICCGPKQPYANMFIESEAIEARLLMGAQTAKYRPDGFLYYQTSIWNSAAPISGESAFTDWDPRSWHSYHGDGSWLCCGPGGMPVATIRLENFRDGMEDYAYVLELERLIALHPSAEWADEARRLVAVPRRLVGDMKTFSDSPSDLYAWRNRIGELIDVCDSVMVDADMQAGNIIVDGIDGDTIRVRQDLRDSDEWFYWAFRVRGAAGRTLKFEFTDKYGGGPVGVRGPVVSKDGGKTFSYPLDGKSRANGFTYSFGPGEDDVLFYECYPYVRANWDVFVAKHADAVGRKFVVGTLCKSRKGADVPCARFGCIDREPKFRVFMSARHHCSETMASWVLEGVGEAFLSDDGLGNWLRGNVELMMVPFADYDGAQAGDQGKWRRPHDHNRDYAEFIYPETKAITEWIAGHAGGRLDMFIDVHCPWLSGKYNEWLYTPWKDPKILPDVAAEHRFSTLLEKLQCGTMRYRATDDLQFGKEWNTGGNYAQGWSAVTWACRKVKGLKVVRSCEVPFANANGAVVTPESCRDLGRDIAKVFRAILEEQISCVDAGGL